MPAAIGRGEHVSAGIVGGLLGAAVRIGETGGIVTGVVGERRRIACGIGEGLKTSVRRIRRAHLGAQRSRISVGFDNES
jgi:hypothetical protein